MASSKFKRNDGVEFENIQITSESISTASSGNLLLCSICHDYYNDPCLLSCFHTFCARCIHQPQLNGQISCPICGQTTLLKDGAQPLPSDQLIQHLLELVNCENPPCANCEKRDKTTMFFCTTCGQALCMHCKEHTHRAKMFSSHEVIHMSKCKKDLQTRCQSHGEQYIMFSRTAKCMLCAICFRDTPSDAQLHCVNIDTAWQQASKKLERAVNSIYKLQTIVSDTLFDFKIKLDELKKNFDTEKQALNIYCQGIKEIVNRTHSSVLLELHRDFDAKEKIIHGQLLSLSNTLPVLQIHFGLCTAFTNSMNKYQFLELAHLMIERLDRVAQIENVKRPSVLSVNFKKSYKNEFIRNLQPFVFDLSPTTKEILHNPVQSQQLQQHESQFLQQCKLNLGFQTKLHCESVRFNNHCKIFDNQFEELNNQLKIVKDGLEELHQDITLLRGANTLTLQIRYENISKECRLLEQQLEQHHIELEKLRIVFDALWEEQYCRIQMEKEMFYSQINDILLLKGEIKQLQSVAQQLEPFIKSFIKEMNTNEDVNYHKHFQTLVNHLEHLKMENFSQSQVLVLAKENRDQRNVTANILDSKEMETVIDSSENGVDYNPNRESKEGVLNQLIKKNKIKEGRVKCYRREKEEDNQNQTRLFRKSSESIKLKSPGHLSTNKVFQTLNDADLENDISIEVCKQQFDDFQHYQGNEYEYQQISKPSSVIETKKRVLAQVHTVPEDLISLNNSEKVFDVIEKNSVDKKERQCRRGSYDNLSIGSGTGRSSINDEEIGLSTQDTRKTLVFFIGSSPMASSLMNKQHSWETFPRPKSKRNISISYGETSCTKITGNGNNSKTFNQLKKTDSFEGHEEAVRTLVAAVQETRSKFRQHHLRQHRYHRKSKTN